MFADLLIECTPVELSIASDQPTDIDNACNQTRKPLDDRVAQIEHHVSRRKRVDVVPTQRYFPKVLLQACEIHRPPVTPRIELPMQPHADPVFRAIDAILAMEMDLGGLLSCAQRE